MKERAELWWEHLSSQAPWGTCMWFPWRHRNKLSGRWCCSTVMKMESNYKRPAPLGQNHMGLSPLQAPEVLGQGSDDGL